MIGYLGLGSNVGDRMAAIAAAAARLDGVPGIRVLAASSVYETEPVGEVPDQRAFLNACLRIGSELAPEALLAACQAVERAGGRDPATRRHGPRRIDVDVLLLGDLVRDHAPVVPHPALLERRFVLVPLLELDPELVVPGRGRAADAHPADAWVRRVGTLGA